MSDEDADDAAWIDQWGSLTSQLESGEVFLVLLSGGWSRRKIHIWKNTFTSSPLPENLNHNSSQPNHNYGGGGGGGGKVLHYPPATTASSSTTTNIPTCNHSTSTTTSTTGGSSTHPPLPHSSSSFPPTNPLMNHSVEYGEGGRTRTSLGSVPEISCSPPLSPTTTTPALPESTTATASAGHSPHNYNHLCHPSSSHNHHNNEGCANRTGDLPSASALLHKQEREDPLVAPPKKLSPSVDGALPLEPVLSFLSLHILGEPFSS